MTSKKKADRPIVQKGTKTNMEEKTKKKSQSKKTSKSTKNKISNGSVNEDDFKVLIVPSSTADDSQNEQVVEEIDEEEEEEDETKKSDITNQRSNKSKQGDDKKKKKKNKNKDKTEGNDSRENSLYTFPMNRVHRLIKSEDSNIRVTQEAIFLVNKASEKFLELFCKEAYASSVLEHKKFVSYEHLSSVVSKRKRFDFLTDFVPGRVKAEEALAEVTLADET